MRNIRHVCTSDFNLFATAIQTKMEKKDIGEEIISKLKELNKKLNKGEENG
jgi:hypothetical protein